MKLYRIENGLANYWVIAEHPTEAENKLLSILNKANYGFFNDRKVISITMISEQIEDDIDLGVKFLIC